LFDFCTFTLHMHLKLKIMGLSHMETWLVLMRQKA